MIHGLYTWIFLVHIAFYIILLILVAIYCLREKCSFLYYFYNTDFYNDNCLTLMICHGQYVITENNLQNLHEKSFILISQAECH